MGEDCRATEQAAALYRAQLPGQFYVQDLMALTGLSRSRCSAIIAGLVRSGYLRREGTMLVWP